MQYVVHVIFKVAANSVEDAENLVGETIGTIPDYVVDMLADDPYILKVENGDAS